MNLNLSNTFVKSNNFGRLVVYFLIINMYNFILYQVDFINIFIMSF